MAKFLLPLILLILPISLILNFYTLKHLNSDNLVVMVADGDTFQLKSGQRVRLMGADAPEYNRCAGPEAKQKLSQLILGKSVELKESIFDDFGRTMALVYVGKNFVNQEMMSAGWARPDYKKNSQRDLLTAAFHQAQNSHLGLWSLCINPNPPNSPDFPNRPCSIKANIDAGTGQKFYHFPSCQHYNETILNTAYGEAWFCTEKEALAAGFKKSLTCN